MRLYFKSATVEKAGEDWPLGHYGNSGIDGHDYALATHHLRADEVPEPLCDAKTTSEFIAGLLNCYYKKIDATKLKEDEIKRMGVYVEKEDAPPLNPNQKEIPF